MNVLSLCTEMTFPFAFLHRRAALCPASRSARYSLSAHALAVKETWVGAVWLLEGDSVPWPMASNGAVVRAMDKVARWTSGMLAPWLMGRIKAASVRALSRIFPIFYARFGGICCRKRMAPKLWRKDFMKHDAMQICRLLDGRRIKVQDKRRPGVEASGGADSLVGNPNVGFRWRCEPPRGWCQLAPLQWPVYQA